MDIIQTQIDAIAKALKSKLSNTEISRADISEKTGKSIGTISNCLKGKNFNIDSLLGILSCLDMNFYDFAEFMKANKYEMPKFENSVTSLKTEVIKDAATQGVDPVQLAMRTGTDIDVINKAIDGDYETEDDEEELDEDDDDGSFDNEEEEEEEESFDEEDLEESERLL